MLRVGVPPRGSPVSGCRIVSKALELSDHTVERIWKERIWRRSFGLVMQKHSRAIATRTGLSQFHLLRTEPLLSPNPPKDTDGRREESGRG